MQFSGLLLAGANNAWLGNLSLTKIEDGILTAEEISQMDLSGTKIVVLSACDSGLGKVDDVDGVYGLQRGFKMAGVDTIVMSLWKVSDDATKILMVEFYRNLISGKKKCQSLTDAQKYLRKVENGKYDKPQFWASFIMLDGLN
jgi:CHAT domain-containing protein